MICYRDRTYCDAPCVTVWCSRRLTTDVEEDAQRVGLHLSLADLRTTCDAYRPPLAINPASEDVGPVLVPDTTERA